MRIFLNTGREISLVRIHQSLTYYGALGIPYREINARTVQAALDEARRVGPQGSVPRLIPPVIVLVDLPPPSPAALKRMGRTDEQYDTKKRWTYERLPDLTCIGMFDSNEVNKTDSEPYSSMIIVWFQEKFALPIDENVLSQIRRRDWDAQAKDWIW